ncbi:MAG: hypothetical protein AB8B85_05230 [Paracoccaceae bacterium]
MRALGLWMLAWALGVLPGTFAAAKDRTLTANNGVVLPAPQIEGLACSKLQDLMYLYSASAYRKPGIIPSEGPDLELLVYENTLAMYHYETCQPGRNDFSSASEAFGKGFN